MSNYLRKCLSALLIFTAPFMSSISSAMEVEGFTSTEASVSGNPYSREMDAKTVYQQVMNQVDKDFEESYDKFSVITRPMSTIYLSCKNVDFKLLYSNGPSALIYMIHPLAYAIQEGDTERVKKFLSYVTDVDDPALLIRMEGGLFRNMVHIVCQMGNFFDYDNFSMRLQLLDWLAEKKFDFNFIDKKDPNLQSPLQRAMDLRTSLGHDRMEVVARLLLHGADQGSIKLPTGEIIELRDDMIKPYVKYAFEQCNVEYELNGIIKPSQRILKLLNDKRMELFISYPSPFNDPTPITPYNNTPYIHSSNNNTSYITIPDNITPDYKVTINKSWSKDSAYTNLMNQVDMELEESHDKFTIITKPMNGMYIGNKNVDFGLLFSDGPSMIHPLAYAIQKGDIQRVEKFLLSVTNANDPALLIRNETQYQNMVHLVIGDSQFLDRCNIPTKLKLLDLLAKKEFDFNFIDNNDPEGRSPLLRIIAKEVDPYGSFCICVVARLLLHGADQDFITLPTGEIRELRDDMIKRYVNWAFEQLIDDKDRLISIINPSLRVNRLLIARQEELREKEKNNRERLKKIDALNFFKFT